MKTPLLVGCLLLVSLTVPASTQTLGLVAAYNFEELSGNAVTDVSGNGNTGTLTSATRTASGKYGRGVTFNGTTAYMSASDAASLDLGNTGSILVWMNQTTARDYAGLVHKGALTNFSDEAYSLQFEGTTRRPSVYLNSATAGKTLAASTALSLATWHHVAVAWDATGMRLYLNGVLNTSVAGAFTPMNSAGALFLGAQMAGQYGFAGTLDDVRIYNRALDAADVVLAMNTPLGGGAPGDTTGPTVAMTAPGDGSQVTGTQVAVTATATDASGIGSVQFLLDNQPLGSPVIGTSPFGTALDSTQLVHLSQHTLAARATDTIGNVTTSAAVTVTVSNPPPPPPPVFLTETIANGLVQPVVLAFSPVGGDIFVGEKASGVVKVFTGGVSPATTLLTLPSFIPAPQFLDSYFERGLLGMAFDPAFTINRFIYLYYSVCKAAGGGPGGCAAGSAVNRVARFTIDASGNATNHTILIDDIPSPNGNHNGGWIGFGPSDGKLYVAVGDGGGSPATSPAQSLNSLNGKILRLNTDPLNRVPADNPFVGQVGALPEIWALGLRNPWRCRFHPDDRLFCGDVGETSWEEIDVVTKAGNYGWPVTEGDFDPALPAHAGFTRPIFWYSRGAGAAIVGGDFGSKTNFPGDFQQSFFISDYVNGWIKRVVLDASGLAVAGGAVDFINGVGSPVDLVAGPDFSLYFVDMAAGTLRRISLAGAGNHSPVAVIATNVTQGQVPLTVAFSGAGSTDLDNDALEYAWDFGDGETSLERDPVHQYTSRGTFTATLTVSDNKTIPGPGVATVQIRVGAAPEVTIGAPTNLSLFTAGQPVPLSGNAFDPDETLPGTSAHWKVIRWHDTHFHPFVEDITGFTGSFTPDSTAEASSNIWYEITLTVTDSAGLVGTATALVYPRIVTLTFATNPAGLQVTFNGQVLTTPTVDAVVGFSHVIGTPSPQTTGGQNYAFQTWSDGGAQSHALVTPAASTTYTATFAVPPPPPPPPTGLVAAYSFEELSGNTVIDVSGTGNTGTITNATRTATGKYGRGLTFSGTSAYVSVPDSASLDLGATGTIAAWVYQTTVVSSAGLVHKGQLSSLGDEAYGLRFSGTSRRPRVDLRNASTTKNLTATSAGALSLAAWHHVAATWDSTGVKIYLNGVLNTSVAGAFTPRNSAGALLIGARTPGLNGFAGTLDDVGIFNRALTAAEIVQVRDTPLGGGGPGDTTGPTVAMTAPADATQISGTQVAVTATATDTSGIGSVQFLLDGQPLGSPVVGTSPFSVTLNSTTLVHLSQHTLAARATDTIGNVTTSTAVTVTVSNPTDVTPPDVTLLTPTDGSNVAGIVSLVADADDAGGIAGVQFFVDNVALGPELPPSATNYTAQWSTVGLTGSHTIEVRGRDLANLMASDSATVVVNAAPIQGLVAAYGMNEFFGVGVPDSSGNENTGTLFSGTWVPGRYGNALSLTGGHVIVPDDPTLDLTTAGTISAWVQSTGSLDWAGIVHKGQNPDFSDEAFSFQGANGVPALYLNSASASQTFTATGTPTGGVWHYLAVTWGATGVQFYVDGALSSSSATVPLTLRNSVGPLVIGSQYPNGFPLLGLIDEVRVYNRALTIVEVQTDMNTPIGDGQLPPPGPITVASGDTLNDQYFAWENTYPNRQDGSYAWYSIQMAAGTTYTFTTSNAQGGNTADTYLYLFGPSGSQVASDDNSGGGQAARLTYEALAAGVYIVKLRATTLGTFGYATLAVTSTGQQAGTPVLPDLIVWQAQLRDARIVNSGGEKRLNFSNGAVNLGPGTLDLYGVVQPDGTTFGYQRVWNNNNTFTDYLAGTFSFPGHGTHTHWHFDNFANYYLRAATGTNGDTVGAILKSSDKVSFCVTEGTAYDLSLPGAPQFAVHSCSNQGISVGWADIYDRGIEGQDIIITGVADGVYWLETVVDPSNLLREINDANNADRIKIRITGNTVTILN
jgi:glucose/arabinose dehydrogenase